MLHLGPPYKGANAMPFILFKIKRQKNWPIESELPPANLWFVFHSYRQFTIATFLSFRFPTIRQRAMLEKESRKLVVGNTEAISTESQNQIMPRHTRDVFA
jgi:hypothetical protein